MSQINTKQEAIRISSLANGIALYRRVMAKFTQANVPTGNNEGPAFEESYIASKLTDKILKNNGEAQ